MGTARFNGGEPVEVEGGEGSSALGLLKELVVRKEPFDWMFSIVKFVRGMCGCCLSVVDPSVAAV